MARRAARVPFDDTKITLRLKHGIHTVFLFVMYDWTFERISAELLSILQDRFPEGLTSSISPPKTTRVPPAGSAQGEKVRIAYGVPRNPTDPSQGWINLNASYTDTVFEKGLADYSSVAFALIPAGQDVDDSDVVFDVEILQLDDEMM